MLVRALTYFNLSMLKLRQIFITTTTIFQNLFLPVSWVYKIIMQVRNLLYNYGIKKVYVFPQPIISIGNLTLGGTGKTPCIVYLTRLLQAKSPLILLSRGYQRKTKGFKIAQPEDTALTIGDESYQLYRQFGSYPEIHIVVCEDRAQGIVQASKKLPPIQAILLDDAFQHRNVQPSLNILLTTFQRPFFIDAVIPAGRLRESRHAARRADIVIVTKCPAQVSKSTKALYQKRIIAYCKDEQVPVFFARIKYHKPTAIWPEKKPCFANNVLLITGIAQPETFVSHVSQQYNLAKHMAFKDHHYFMHQDITAILQTFYKLPYKKKCLLTTEKDSVRLMQPSIKVLLENIPIFYVPIDMELLEAKKRFKQLIFATLANQ
jgi:tetraacyldisaccharide 4'-kinase